MGAPTPHDLPPPGRAERAWRWSVFLSALALYVATVFPSWGGRFEWGDAAKWQYVGSILGLPHPPGSPLYVLATWLWTRVELPMPLAVQVNLFSALPAAGAVLCVALSARRLGLSRLASTLAAATLALSLPLWVFATEAEVYSTLALGWCLAMDRALAWRAGRRDRDFLVGAGALLLCLSDHYTVVLLAPALLAFALATDARVFLRPRVLPGLLAAVVLALLPYAWVWFAAPDAPYSEMAAPASWATFKDYVLAQQYQDSLWDYGWTDLALQRPGWALTELGSWTGYGAVLLAPLGAWALARRDRAGALLVAGSVLVPAAFWIGYRVGDPMGFGLPLVPGLAIAFGAALDGLSPPGRSVVHRALATAAFLALSAPAVVNARHVIVDTDPLQVMTREVDGDPDYRWDLDCVIRAADRGARILPPWGDYGTRQAVNYHLFGDPATFDKDLVFHYLPDRAGGFGWAPKAWEPNPRAAAVVWAFTKGDADRLRRAGYDVGTIPLGEAECGPGTRPFLAWRGEARR